MPPTQRPEAQSRLCHRDRAGPSGAAAENRPAHRALRVPSGVCSFIFIKVFCVLSCFSLKTRHQAGGARTSAPGGADAVAVTSKPSSHVPATKAKWWPQTPAVCGVSAQPGRSTADARSLIRPHPGRRGGLEPEQLPAWPLRQREPKLGLGGGVLETVNKDAIMGLQAGASTAAHAGSEARGSEGGTMAGGRDEGPGGGAREAGTGEGASAAGRAAGPGRVSLLPEGGAPEVRGPTLSRAPRCGPGSRWAARAALRGASYLCCPCLCRPPSCCGAVAGERPVAKLGHGVLTPSSSAASRPWRMGGSESRGKETLGRESGEGTLRARAPPAPARTLWRSEARICARDPFSRVGGFSLFCPVPSPEP